VKLEKELGGYSRWVIREILSFQCNTTNPPTIIRDGNSRLVLSVTRVSAGLFTVAMRTDRPSVKLYVVTDPALSQINTPPTQNCSVAFVEGSWNKSAGTFQLQVFSSAASAAAVDPDAGCRISVEMIGSINTVGTDAA
jgi:hypothetical protein